MDEQGHILTTPRDSERDRSRTLRRSESRSVRSGSSRVRYRSGPRSSRYRSRSRSAQHHSRSRGTQHRSGSPSARQRRGRQSSISRYSEKRDSCHRSLREWEQQLEREQRRLRHLEQELEKERDAGSQSRRSERCQRSLRQLSHQNDGRSHDEQSPEVQRTQRRSTSRGRRSRSCSPSFTTKDICKIIQCLKSESSQPLEHNANSGSKFDHKNILPEFDPSVKNQRIDIWLRKVNECASVYGWDDNTTIHFSMQKLQGLAKVWYQGLNTIMFTWSEWQEKLLKAFPCEQNYGQSLEDMLRRKSRYGEPIENYYYEKLALLNQCDITGKRAVDCIIHGLTDRTTKSSALALRCTEPDQLLQFLMSNKEHSSQVTFRSKNATGFSNNSSDNGQQRYNMTQNPLLFCYNCKEKGHPYLKCKKPLVKCETCHKIGHKSENCRSNLSTQSTNAPIANTMCIFDSSPNNKFIKQVSVNGNTLEAFVDFGSEVTLIRESIVVELGITHDCVLSLMRGFGNGFVQSIGSTLLRVSIDGVEAIVSCKVVSDNFLEKPLLIGQSFTEQPHILVVKDSTKLHFLDVGTELPSLGFNDNEPVLMRIRLIGSSILCGMASVKAATELVYCGEVLLETNVVGKPGEQYMVIGGIYLVSNGCLNVTVIPCSDFCLLHKNFVFARAHKVNVIHKLVSEDADKDLPNSFAVDHINENQVNIGEAVTEQDRIKLLTLLEQYKRCFAFGLKDLGCTDVTEMKIELTSDRPIVYRPYRLSHHEREKVRGMVDEMLDAGIIRESTSNYASPIILVRKKDDKVRMCIDYRLLNAVTLKERYPMPIIEDEISRLSGQAWFITLDLISGYYQVPIAEQHKHLTAFVTPDGQYEFNRMPFGLANAPAVFQRMMNHVLGSARFNKATVYIDDLLIYGNSIDQALSRLRDILQLLSNANLKLNLSKCSFLQSSINYLGYEISSSGVRPCESKIRSVMNFPMPTNVHTVRQFLGLVGYFRKFIRGFAELASPLTKLLKKDCNWQWSDEQLRSFEELKTRLVNRPILAIYDYSAETELHTDASRIGLGSILLQRSRSTDTLLPVAYYSRQTSPEEKNFHSYELETLAVVCALKKFRVYLLGKSFKIVTDCSALRSTFQKRDLIPRIARWWILLQEFDCTIEYRAGTKMTHADALSRNPVNDSQTETDLVQVPTILTISDDDWLLTLQLGDTELARIRNIVKSNIDSQGLEYIRENYVIRDNKLFRCIDGDKEILRWVVPKGARWQVCKLNHDDIGHVGYEKTLERIKKHYWFSKMTRFVKKYVAACVDCAYSKKKSTSREGLLHPIAKIEIPFHTLHIDHLGPFVRSKRGYTHLVVIVDSFTKFVFIKPVRNTKSINVIKVLEDIFDTFRNPNRIISDRGSCFTAHVFKRFCLDRGVKHILNAVASPRSNGQVERYNRTILDSLTAQNLKSDEKEWDTKIGRIQWGLNNTVQKTIGRAPAEVLFGTKMDSERKPILNEIVDMTREPCDLTTIRDEVKSKIDLEQVKQKQYYDKGRKPARLYGKGDLVKVTKTAFQNDGKSSKLLPVYEGPYKIIKVLGNDRYRVAPIPGFEGMKNKRKTTVAADRMRPWINIESLNIDNDNTETESISDDEISL